MRPLALHAATALMALMCAVCLLAAAGAAALVGGVLSLPAAVFAGVVTFQALRVPVGRTTGRLLER